MRLSLCLPYSQCQCMADSEPSWFADQTHANGMAIGLKNSGNLLSSWEGVATKFQAALVKAFDFSVIESCVRLPLSAPRTNKTPSIS